MVTWLTIKDIPTHIQQDHVHLLFWFGVLSSYGLTDFETGSSGLSKREPDPESMT